MNTNEYLQKALAAQTLGDDSEELKALQAHRADVEALLREELNDCSPTIRYAGSKAKGTMIRESYDLDIICYFQHGDTKAGATLEEVYNNTKSALSKSYFVDPKQSALRLRGLAGEHLDFHVDVVPGRFTDDTMGDAYIYKAGADKCRLKTNINVHVEHVKASGVRDAIRLMKLWNVRNNIGLKNFVLELAVIKLLKNKKSASLSTQLEHVWTEFRDNIDNLTVEDPANPEGNDLSGALSSAKAALKTAASFTLSVIEASGWQTVFGVVEDDSEAENLARLRRVAAGVPVPSRPWCE